MKYWCALLILCLSTSSLFAALCDFTGPSGSSWSEPDNWTCDCSCPEKVPEMGDDVFISGKTVILDLGIQVKSINLMAGAILESPTHLLEITEGLIWASGTIKTSVRILSFGAVAMVTGGPKTLDGNLALDTGVSATWDAGSFSISVGGELLLAGDPGLPPAEFAITFDGDIGGADGLISNGGVFKKVAGMGTSTISPGFTNGGGIVVMSGTLEMDQGISDNSGSLDIAAGTALRILGSSAHAMGATIGGGGSLELSDTGPHDLDLDFSGPTEIIFDAETVHIEGLFNPTADVELRSGLVAGGGLLIIEGDMIWRGGGLGVNTDFLDLSSLELSTTAVKTLTAIIDHEGLTDWQDGNLFVNAGGSFINNGAFDIGGMGDEMAFALPDGPGTFINNGSFTSLGGGSTEIGLPFTNTSIVHIDNGQLEFTHPATFSSGALLIDEGETLLVNTDMFFAAPAGILGQGEARFSSGTSRLETTVIGRLDKWIISGGELQIDAAIDPEAFETDISAGKLDLQENILPDSLIATISGGTLEISSSISPIHFFLTQSAGTVDLEVDLDGPQTTLVQSGGTLKGIVEGFLSELTLTESFDWTGGLVDLVITGDGSSTIALSGPATKTLGGVISHDGLTSWSDGNLAIPLGGGWENGGTFHVSSDSSMTGDGSFSNSGTFLKTGSGDLSIAPSFSNGGTLAGVGGLSYGLSFANTGVTRPGLSPGMLRLSQQFSNGSRLELELADNSGPGLGHDLLIVNDTAWLSDSLIVTELGSVPDGSYTVLICRGEGQCLQGDFDVAELPPTYTYSLTDTSVVLIKGALPVSWQSFSARGLRDRVQLDWTTATEQNNDYFVIERALGGAAFIEIGEVAGSGNTDSPTSYQFFDQALPNYSTLIAYRIKQVDLDGSFSYSPIDQVRWQGNRQPFYIDLAHLPSPNELHIRLQRPASSRALRLALIDLHGRVLQEMQLASEQEEIFWPLSRKLPQGIYFIRAEDGQQMTSSKLLQGY
ncbi:MAG: hypothetical protein AAF433_16185 [Bacteroidota bacterium]